MENRLDELPRAALLSPTSPAAPLRLIMTLTDISDAILAMRAAGALLERKARSGNAICVFEGGRAFYAKRLKSGTITVREGDSI